ncbi:Luciferin 4-monooxygenase [Pseudolycoriella hygida]|uniref:Luciferin 4-monooxygenase n=1 Tax=Pseudolycoriella hygida TaxID=35572 RepID=A0A9Q0N1G2_9DIPT|nr:Luciferin 4-monooxygenase [Pseudolycoriella hygida]
MNILYGGNYERRFEHKSMGDFIVSSLRRNGDRKALINGTTGLTWTSREFLDQLKRYSRMLFGLGIRRNSVVGIVSENRHEVAAIMFASLCISAVPSPINFTYTKRELKHSLDLSQPKYLFVSSSTLANVQGVIKNLPYVEKVILFDEVPSNNECFISLNELLSKYEDTTFDLETHVQQPVNIREQTSMIFLSSGTTGYSKGVEKSCENLIVCFEQYAHEIMNLSELPYDINTLVIGPWFHVMGFTNLFILLFSDRFSCVFLPKFEPHLFLKTIESYKIASIPIPPPIVVLLAKSPLVNDYDISSLKYIFTGAAPLSYDIEEQIEKRYKGQIKLLRGYGLSEAIITVYTIDVKNPPPGSVGRLLKGCYGKVIDESGCAVGPNIVGEICHKGALVMKGYYKNPKATAESIDREGWFRTGDLGYYDEELNFFIVDRLKELIKYKGFQVAPAELEGLLLSNPKIKDAGVIGIPDEVAGELPMAFVVKQANVEITEDEVKDFVVERISKTKWLRGGVRFVDEIPKNPSGKILRRHLREFYKNTKPKFEQMIFENNIISAGKYPEPECCSLGDLIVKHLRRRANEVILINGVSGNKWLGSDVLEYSVHIGQSLHQAGVKENDVVSILSDNRLEFIGIAFGTTFLNAKLAPINFNYTKNELRHSLNLTKPKIVFTTSVAVESILELMPELTYIQQVVLLDDRPKMFPDKAISWKHFLDICRSTDFVIDKFTSRPINMRIQTSIIFLSSGTTGIAKGCEITQYNMAVTIYPLEKALRFLRQFTKTVVNLNISPWFHVMGHVHIFSNLLSESFVCVFLPKFDSNHFLQAIETYKVNATSVPPPVMVFLSKSPVLDKFDLTSLRMISCGGAPLKHQTEGLIKQRFKVPFTIFQGYGLTETTAGIIRSVYGKETPGSTGMVEEGISVKVIDERGNALGPNKVGEICAKGNRIMKGYLNDAKATNETIDVDGWLHTGDLGYYNEDFQFFIVDRVKELIKYKGFQVAPAELEGLLLTNPKCKDCGVIGIPDDVSGELPFAFVVKQDDVELTENEVQEFVRKNTSNAKWLRGGVQFIDEIPKNPSETGISDR